MTDSKVRPGMILCDTQYPDKFVLILGTRIEGYDKRYPIAFVWLTEDEELLFDAARPRYFDDWEDIQKVI